MRSPLECTGGRPIRAAIRYLDHPLRVAESVRGEGRDAVIAAMLHDVIEDSGISAAELRAEGFPEAAVHAVEIVTKRDGEHGDEDGYQRFIERVATSGSRLAVIVKLADLAGGELRALVCRNDGQARGGGGIEGRFAPPAKRKRP